MALERLGSWPLRVGFVAFADRVCHHQSPMLPVLARDPADSALRVDRLAGMLSLLVG
jgi:hypothetical protein